MTTDPDFAPQRFSHCGDLQTHPHPNKTSGIHYRVLSFKTLVQETHKHHNADKELGALTVHELVKGTHSPRVCI